MISTKDRFEEMFVALALQHSGGDQVWFMEQLAPETERLLRSIASKFFDKACHLINADSLKPGYGNHLYCIAEGLWKFNQGDRGGFINIEAIRFPRAYDMTQVAGDPNPIMLIKDGQRIIVSQGGKLRV